MPKIKVVGQTVRTGEHTQTDKQTNGWTDATKYIISLASRSIKIKKVPPTPQKRPEDGMSTKRSIVPRLIWVDYGSRSAVTSGT